MAAEVFRSGDHPDVWLADDGGAVARRSCRPGQAGQQGARSITEYGAQSNGGDATAAINNAINAAKNRLVKSIHVPSGTFKITGINIDGGVKMIGNRDASVLFAPNPANRQVKLAGSGAGIYSLKILTYGTNRTNDNEGIWIDYGANNFVIDDVTIDGGNGPGIITYGGNYGRITSNRVMNAKSNSIHMSGGAHHIYIAGDIVRNSGDDMIAVVTYAYHPVNTNQILIANNDVDYQPWGRGVTIVSGENVTIRNNKVKRSSDAGIYIAAKSSWATRGIKNVLVEKNTLDRTPNADPEHGQSSILVYSDNSFLINGVALKYNKITNAVNGALRVQPRNVSNVSCIGNTLDGAGVSAQNCNGNPGSVSGTSVTPGLLGRTRVRRHRRRCGAYELRAALKIGSAVPFGAALHVPSFPLYLSDPNCLIQGATGRGLDRGAAGHAGRHR